MLSAAAGVFDFVTSKSSVASPAIVLIGPYLVPGLGV